jgi:hypothetical protein
VRAVFGAIADSSEFDAAAATELGDERAREGVPLASVMEAYRVGFRGAWETMAEEAATRPRASREALRALTAKLLMAVHLAQTISEEVKLYQSSGQVRFDVVVATSSVRVQTASAISANLLPHLGTVHAGEVRVGCHPRHCVQRTKSGVIIVVQTMTR